MKPAERRNAAFDHQITYAVYNENSIFFFRQYVIDLTSKINDLIVRISLNTALEG